MKDKYKIVFILILFISILPQVIAGESQSLSNEQKLKKEEIDKTLIPAKKNSLRKTIEEDKLFKKIKDLESFLSQYKEKILESESKKAESLYKKALIDKQIAWNLFKQKKYKVALEYLKGIEDLIKRIDTLIEERRNALSKFSKLKELLKIWEREISSFKEDPTKDLFHQAQEISETAQNLIKEERYIESCQKIELAREYFEEANELFQERRSLAKKKEKAKNELNSLKKKLIQAEEEGIFSSKDKKITQHSKQAEKLIQEADDLIKEQFYQEALEKIILAKEHLNKAKKLFKEKEKQIIKKAKVEEIPKREEDKKEPSKVQKQRIPGKEKKKKEKLPIKITDALKEKENIFQKIKKLESLLSQIEDKVLKSGSKKAISLYHRAIESKAVAKILFQQGKYKDIWKYIKDIENKNKEIDFVIKERKNALAKLKELEKSIEERKEISSSKDSKAKDYFNQSEQLFKIATDLMKKEQYRKACKSINLAMGYLEEANLLFFFSKVKEPKAKKEERIQRDKVLKETLEKKLTQTKSKVKEKKLIEQTQLKKISQKEEKSKVLPKRKFEEIPLGKKEEILKTGKKKYILKKETLDKEEIEEKRLEEINIREELKRWSKAIQSTEEVVRKSAEEQAFIYLWRAKELHLKTEIDYKRGRLKNSLNNLKQIALYVSKANNIAFNSINLAKEIEFKSSCLEELISKVELYLKRETDKEVAKKTRRFLWKAKKHRIQSKMYLAREEKEKALAEVKKGIEYGKKALSYIKGGKEVDIEERARLRLAKLSNLISKAERKLDLVNDYQSKNIIADAKRVREIALRYFKERDYLKALEGFRIGIILVYKAMGVIPDNEDDGLTLRKLVKEIEKLEEILSQASFISKNDLKVQRDLDKAIELHRKAVISLYVDKDYSQAEIEINKALECALKILEKNKAKSPHKLAYERLVLGKKLIEKAKKEISYKNNKNAQKVLALSKKYFSKAYKYYKNKDFQKSIENLELSKSFALKAIEIAKE